MIFARRDLKFFGDIKWRKIRCKTGQKPVQIFLNLRFYFERMTARVMRRKIKRIGICGKNAARIFRFRCG